MLTNFERAILLTKNYYNNNIDINSTTAAKQQQQQRVSPAPEGRGGNDEQEGEWFEWSTKSNIFAKF